MSDAVEGLRKVEGAVALAAADCDRPPGAVCLIAVSKTIPQDGIRPVLESGHRVFGENYVQEAAGKWPALRDEFAGTELHLIGPLQSNKARDAVALFDAVQSLDRPSLAAALAKAIERAGRAPVLFCQVNIGEEPQKGGVLPKEADAFLAACRRDYGLSVTGLMCIPPADDPPSPHFALLRSIAARNGIENLSMGMSGDYRAAIQLGATHVRVGTAIFGARARADHERVSAPPR